MHRKYVGYTETALFLTTGNVGDEMYCTFAVFVKLDIYPRKVGGGGSVANFNIQDIGHSFWFSNAWIKICCQLT
jgi:hypothetical protein